MIVFDLECSKGHIFEGWFDSHEAFEEQNTKRMVSCPHCDDSNINRVITPVAVRKSNPENQTARIPINYQKLAREVVDYIQKNSEDVGPKFTAEALKIHYGVAEKRNIRGSATSEEEETLKEEGVDFFKVPWPKMDEEKKN